MDFPSEDGMSLGRGELTDSSVDSEEEHKLFRRALNRASPFTRAALKSDPGKSA